MTVWPSGQSVIEGYGLGDAGVVVNVTSGVGNDCGLTAAVEVKSSLLSFNPWYAHESFGPPAKTIAFSTHASSMNTEITKEE